MTIILSTKVPSYPAGELSGVEVPVGDVNENPCAEYSTDKIPGGNVGSGNAKLPGVDTDFDAKPTGVEMDTGVYGKAYDAVPQEQGNKVEAYDLDKVYGLGKQSPTKGMVFVENNIEKYRIKIPTSRAQQL